MRRSLTSTIRSPRRQRATWHARVPESPPVDSGTSLSEQIRPNPTQPRRRFDENSLLALAESIRKHGVLQPIIVRPRKPDGYELIAGERRWRASRMAGLQTIASLVNDAADDASALELALIENIARADLTVIERPAQSPRSSTTSTSPAPTSHAGSGEAAATLPTPSGSSSCPTRQSS